MRFAIVMVADASDPSELWETVSDRLKDPANGVYYLGNPCVVPEAEEYATHSVHLAVDDGLVFTTHPTLLENAESGDEYVARVLRDFGIEIPKDTPEPEPRLGVEAIPVLSEEGLDRELSLALGAADPDDPDNMEWLGRLLAEKTRRLRGGR